MQGDVISLVNCSSTERRKFIDEVAGTADFDRKIEMATKELEGVEERVQNSTIILNEIQSRVEQLKEEISDVKSTIDNQIAKNEQDADSFVGFGTMMEQKIQNNIPAMEILMDDTISKIDSKTDEILNTNN